MSRNAFPAIEREYGDREAMRDIEREERQKEREDLEVLRKREQEKTNERG